ncbi:MAG: metal-dependent hydrolase [Pyrinomonadaceae bacterium]
MDNITHSLVGLVASKAGLEKLSPKSTAVCALAANAPDSDIVTLLLGDRWTYLHHHRGITHSIIGTLVLALIVPVAFCMLDRLVARVRKRQPSIRLKGLLVASLVVSATHPLMDWTNNYGVRLLLPWSSRWFYGDLVFIVDPFLWLALGGAAFLLTSRAKWQIVFWIACALVLTYMVMVVSIAFGPDPYFVRRASWLSVLTGLAVAFKLNVVQKWGHKIAIAAFALILLYWGGLAFLHSLALSEARTRARIIAVQNGEAVTDVVAMPTLANPFRWQCIVETENAAYQFELSLLNRQAVLGSPDREDRAESPGSQVVERAAQDRRAQIFLEFARFPVVRVVDAECLTQTLVQFADLRYTKPGSRRGTFALEIPIECARRDQDKAQ